MKLYDEGVFFWLSRSTWTSTIKVSSLTPSGNVLGTRGAVAKRMSDGKVEVIPKEISHQVVQFERQMRGCLEQYGVRIPQSDSIYYTTQRTWDDRVKPRVDAVTQEFESWKADLASRWLSYVVPEADRVIRSLAKKAHKANNSMLIVSETKYISDFLDKHIPQIPTAEQVTSSYLKVSASRMHPIMPPGGAEELAQYLASTVVDREWVDLRKRCSDLQNLLGSAGEDKALFRMAIHRGFPQSIANMLERCKASDPCPELSQGMYADAQLVLDYLKTMRVKLSAQDPGALAIMVSTLAPVLRVLYSTEHRELRIAAVMG